MEKMLLRDSLKTELKGAVFDALLNCGEAARESILSAVFSCMEVALEELRKDGLIVIEPDACSESHMDRFQVVDPRKG